MRFVIKWQKKREAIHDFKKVIYLQRRHLDEITRRQKEISPYMFGTIRFVLEENIDFYKSIVSLFEKGHFRSCLLIGRSIMENSINLQYILREDSDRRAKNFLFHSTTHTLKELRSMNEDQPGITEMINSLERLEKLVYKSGPNKLHWDGKNFKEICVELGLNKTYDDWYKRLSNYVHPQYKDLRDLEKNGPYNDFLKKMILVDMPVLIFQTLKNVNQKYNLLEGGVIIRNYPKEDAITVFSISSKEVDEKASSCSSEYIKRISKKH